ncbi:hypothetical protein GON03_05630 [Nocardioides sp. MAH-18]|uniref:DUF6285 domain-containing protein n=1 Tax=Nocardioides agri TaxID=2682843 RepID=A0A6L6XN58_9ACTN|nr:MULTISPECIES: DUF6285 domain-containing protein [unclassified Nocardioides]MBA2953789.1 hypothetical protein [Nocardioides sp. CGMCC 1.13656]MVQ48654.1 hypothetical protein [Nocardioides sp. MAH-18]
MSTGGDLYDVPAAGELLDAVCEFLETQVLEAVEGSTRFHTRVAVNALRIVQRELEHGGTDVAAHRARLAELGYADDAALAAVIRSGAEDTRYTEIKDAVTESVRAKLRVDNPRHLEETS